MLKRFEDTEPPKNIKERGELMVLATCPICDHEFKVRWYDVYMGKGRYCHPACSCEAAALERAAAEQKEKENENG